MGRIMSNNQTHYNEIAKNAFSIIKKEYINIDLNTPLKNNSIKFEWIYYSLKNHLKEDKNLLSLDQINSLRYDKNQNPHNNNKKVLKKKEKISSKIASLDSTFNKLNQKIQGIENNTDVNYDQRILKKLSKDKDKYLLEL